MTNHKDIGRLLTTREVAQRIRMSPDFVTHLALTGEIASVKVGTRPGQRGGRRLFPESEIESWLARNLRNG